MPVRDEPLRTGMRSERVRRLQQLLARLGHVTGDEPGTFSDGTRAAVLAFQQEQGLPSTGEVDARTWRRLQAVVRLPGTGVPAGDSRPSGGSAVGLSGRIVDEGGVPKPGVTVRLLDAQGELLGTASTGGEGAFAMRLERPPRDDMRPEGWALELLEAGKRLEVVERRGPEQVEPGQWRVNLTVAGGTAAEPDVEPEEPSGRMLLRGIVRYGAERPAKGVTVRAGLPGVEGTAWLAEAVTGDEGEFALELARLAAGERLRLAVFEGDRPLDVVDQQGPAQTDEGTWRVMLTLAEEAEPGPDGRAYVVAGQLLRADGPGVAGARVAVFRRTLREETRLGAGETNERGFFSISYRPPAGVRRLDVKVRATGQNGDPAAESPLICKAGPYEWVRLVAGNRAYRGPSEFERLAQRLRPHLDGIAPADLLAAQADYLHCATGEETEKIRLLALAHRQAAATGVPAAAHYGLLRQGLPGTLPGLLRQQPSVQRAALDAALAANVVPAALRDEVDGILSRLQQVSVQQALRDSGGQATPLGSLLNLAELPGEQQDELLLRYRRHEGPVEQFWQALRANGQHGQVEQLQRTLQLGTLTGGNTRLVQRLQARGVQQPVELAGVSQAEWLGLVRETGVPPGVPGETEAERAENYVRTMTGLLARAFPSATVVSGLQQAEQTSPELRRFLETNPDFSFEKPLTPYLADPEAPLPELQRLQRLYRLAPAETKVQTMEGLQGAGLNSALAIAQMGRERFVGALGPALGGSLAAQQVYAAAQQTVASSQLLLASYRPHTATPRVLTAVDAAVISDSMPQWSELFGSLDFCACEHCRSVYSPAAYLVDLLAFLRQQPATNGTALDALFERRPDIGEIELSCANTNTVLPYIDLVNEVLESAVLGRRRAYQTGWTAAELEANAEHFTANQAAYGENHLADGQHPHPFSLPFNLWLEEARTYLGHFEVRLAELMRVFQQQGLEQVADPADPLVRRVAAETLGLSPQQRQIVTGDTVVPLEAMWGLDSADPAADLADIPTLLGQAGLAFAGLLELLATRAINPDGSLTVAFAEACQTEGARLIHLRADSSGALQEEPVESGTFERMHRFLRLQGALGWEMAELDEVLVALQAGDLDDAALVGLAQVHELRQELDTPLVEMAAWWGAISTRRDEQDETARSLYEQLFLNNTVLNPVDGAFALNSSGDEVAAAGSESLGRHETALLAALAIAEDELALLLADAGLTEGDALSLANLSALYRRASLARSLELDVAAFLTIKGLSGLDPFAGPGEAVALVAASGFIEESGFSAAELDYLLRDDYQEGAGVAPTEGEIDAFLDSLAQELATIRQSYMAAADPTGEQTAAWLALLLAAGDVETAMAILDGSSSLSEAEQASFVADKMALFVDDVAAAQGALVGGSALPAGQARFEYVLEPLSRYLRDALSAAQAAQQVADELGLEVATATALLRQHLALPADPVRPLLQALLALDAEATTHDPAVIEGYRLLHKVALLLTKLDVAADELGWVFEQGPALGWLDPAALLPAPSTVPFGPWARLARLYALRHRYAAGDDDLFDVLQMAHDGARPAGLVAELSALTGWDEAGIRHLVRHFRLNLPDDAADERFYARLDEAFVLLNRLGMGAEEVTGWQVEADLGRMRQTARRIKSAVKAVYDEESWPAVAAPLKDGLRERQRDALVDYFVSRRAGVHEAADLYDRLLIDVEMNSCMDTSRIKQALASVQLFIQRALMNLEPDVDLSQEAAEQWGWMKNYRVWEANRKVFLYPQNWIYPELRDDKSPLFEELEGALLQDEVTGPVVEEALRRYLEGLDEIANLEVRALCYQREGQPEDDDAVDIVHVIARSTGLPHRTFYRRLEEGRRWTAWEPVPVNIEGEHLLAVIWNNRLHLFWPQFKELKREETPGATPEDPGSLSDLVIFELEKANPPVANFGEFTRYTDFISWKEGLLNGSLEPADVVMLVTISLSLYVLDPAANWPGGESFEIPSDLEEEIAEWLEDEEAWLEASEASEAAAQSAVVTEWEINLAWSDYREGSWSAPTISEEALITPALSKESFCLKVETSGWLADRGPVGDVVISTALRTSTTPVAVGAGDELALGLFWDDFYTISEIYSGRSFRYYGQFVVVGCGGRVAVTAAADPFDEAGDPWPVPSLSRLENMRVLEAWNLDVPLSLPAEASDGSVDKVATLNRTPGQFALAIPHQKRDFLYDDGFFYQDERRAFYVTPRAALAHQQAVEALQVPDRVTFDVEAAVFLHPAVEAGPVGWPTVPGAARRDLDARRRSVAADGNGTPAIARTSSPTEILDQGLVSQHTLKVTGTAYAFDTFYHPYACRFQQELNKGGAEGLLRRDLQMLSAGNFEATYDPVVAGPYPVENVAFGEADAYGLYNYELFFHAPLLIADRLLQNQQFEEAQRWLHTIFNPFLRADDGLATGPERYWVFYPFYQENSGETLYDMMLALNAGDAGMAYQVEQWRKNPFDPHLLARLRPQAYMEAVVMKYLDLLIAWGDTLFRRDTIESINEATLLYVLAAAVLGPRPETLPGTASADDQTFNSLADRLDSFGNALVEVENSLGAPTVVLGSSGTPLPTFDTLYFCIPENEQLLEYWDTVEDRLFKIRNCMNIEGVVRQLALFEPPLDPGALVKAFAAGVDLGSVLDALYAPLPHYRFRVLLQKALEIAGDVRALGGALLAALERRDTETLSLLRAGQEVELLAAVRAVREQQVREAEEAVAGLEKARALTETRRDYYRDIKKVIAGEAEQAKWLKRAKNTQKVINAIDAAAALQALFPQADTGGAGIASPFLVFSFGGHNLFQSLQAVSRGLGVQVTEQNYQATMASIEAGYERRWADWKLQEELAEKELEQIDSQTAAAAIRLEIAQLELANHEKQIANAEAVASFLEEKFSNEALYGWMVSQVSGLYFQAYNLAYDLARQAQRAYEHELGVTAAGFIVPGYWDSLKKGLLAGERLAHDLRRMDAAYLEENRRGYEITKHVSLAQLDPVALVTLQQTGACYLNIPEVLFDMDFPGHYRRRIKSVSLTIPAVTGPYTGVNATLTLLGNQIRIEPQTGSVEEASELFQINVGGIQSIATSSGQNDAGLFELNFQDERYLPFEGAGAVSNWRLELPQQYQPFDYETIADVILHVRYSARDGGAAFKGMVSAQVGEALDSIALEAGREGLWQLISVRQAFPNGWHQFLYPPPDAGEQSLMLDLQTSRFPFRFRQQELEIERMWLLLDLKEGATAGAVEAMLVAPGESSGDAQTFAAVGEQMGGLPQAEWDYGTAGKPAGSWLLQTVGGTVVDPAVVEDLIVLCHFRVGG